MPGVTIAQVKDAAQGRWHEIATGVFGLSPEYLTGAHGPCPRCGGTDRWRVFKDFAETGGAICNQCGPNLGDGIALGEWFTKRTCGETKNDVAKHLGLSNGKPAAAPDDHLRFESWNDGLALLWCKMEPPITVDALKSFGARMAVYRRNHPVFAIPISGKELDKADPIGWAIFSRSGGTLPSFFKNKGQVEQVKVKITYGSKSGLIGQVGRLGKVSSVLKTEGITDALTAASLAPDDTAVVTNSGGAGESPGWMVNCCQGKTVVVVHDCDEPGQSGAIKWSAAFAAAEANVRNVVLPYEITPSGGKDLRDWLAEGHDWNDLEQLAAETPDFDPSPLELISDEIEFYPDDPRVLAKKNLANYRDLGRDLKFWNETWYAWKNGRYTEITPDFLAARIRNSVQEQFESLWVKECENYERKKEAGEIDEKKDKGRPKVRKVLPAVVRAVLEATQSECLLNKTVQLETWLDRKGNNGCVSVENGILDLTARLSGSDEALLPHSPLWFSTLKLPYAYDPHAVCPTWEGFLKDVFNEDEESIETLQRWVGYLLTPDTSIQKILFVIGQTRSGKGTILRVIRSMLGVSNVSAPTLSTLASPFGLECLIGKTVALIPDARISSRTDEVLITERLLSISGNDPQDVRRKYKPTLAGQEMPVRFVLFSNLLPKLRDISSAFLSRCIFLLMPNSYLGREDLTYGDRLQEELPGILNWAIQGRKKLNYYKVIDQPLMGGGICKEMEMILSPVSVFVREKCNLNPECKCSTQNVFEEWKRWCDDHDLSFVGNINSFGRKLRAVIPLVDTKRITTHNGRENFYMGIEIKEQSHSWE
jgi:P4 family phage/plasmid primase-like protien